MEAGLVRGRSTEEKGPGSKVRFELLWGKKEGIPEERMRQQRCGSEDEQGVGLSEEWDVSKGQILQRDYRVTSYSKQVQVVLADELF